VLEEEQATAGPQHPRHLGHRALRVGRMRLRTAQNVKDDEGRGGEARLGLGSGKDRMFMLEEMRMGFSNEVSR
jgi:hypothetical protein